MFLLFFPWGRRLTLFLSGDMVFVGWRNWRSFWFYSTKAGTTWERWTLIWFPWLECFHEITVGAFWSILKINSFFYLSDRVQDEVLLSFMTLKLTSVFPYTVEEFITDFDDLSCKLSHSILGLFWSLLKIKSFFYINDRVLDEVVLSFMTLNGLLFSLHYWGVYLGFWWIISILL